MTYSSKEIAEAVSTVHMNSRRQAKRNLTTNYTNGDINFIGDCCFAYSGVIAVNNGLHTMINFNSGPNFLKVKTSFHSEAISNDDYNQIISFNDIAIINQTVPQTYQSTATGYQPIDLIIPPFTDFKITFQNSTDTSANNWTAVLTGKVYSGAEIIQGAI